MRDEPSPSVANGRRFLRLAAGTFLALACGGLLPAYARRREDRDEVLDRRRPGERIRLRIINAATQSYFNFRIPGLPMTVVQADGRNVEPVVVAEMRLPVAETRDVIVEPEDRSYTIFAESMDRSGFARGTPAPHRGWSWPAATGLVPRTVLPVQHAALEQPPGAVDVLDHRVEMLFEHRAEREILAERRRLRMPAEAAQRAGITRGVTADARPSPARPNEAGAAPEAMSS